MRHVSSFGSSFSNAWRGLRLAFRTERSFRLQIAAALVILTFIAVFPLEAWERSILLFVTLLVLVLELVNSSIERMVDLAKPRLHEYAGDIKDLMAGAVLLASFFAVMIGALILWPHLVASMDRL
jgi:diacylglycerol kinase